MYIECRKMQTLLNEKLLENFFFCETFVEFCCFSAFSKESIFGNFFLKMKVATNSFLNFFFIFIFSSSIYICDWVICCDISGKYIKAPRMYWPKRWPSHWHSYENARIYYQNAVESFESFAVHVHIVFTLLTKQHSNMYKVSFLSLNWYVAQCSMRTHEKVT